MHWKGLKPLLKDYIKQAEIGPLVKKGRALSSLPPTSTASQNNSPHRSLLS
jgi:hypothetical protein